MTPFISKNTSASSQTLTEQDLAWLNLASALSIPSKKWLDAIDASGKKPLDLYRHQSDFPYIQALISKISPSLVERALKWLEREDNRSIISIDSPFYPKSVKQLSNPPLVLFVQGCKSLLCAPQIAIVGSRRASLQGKSIAENFAMTLSARGVTVTSGLASGIDGAAHRGSMKEMGGTIAVMGTGPDNCYPTTNLSLAKEIIEFQGLLVTEFFPGVGPKPWHFPRRNRIIAALSLGTLVVEAKIKSGTLITANLAADMGREVFAVPGNIYHAYSEGCHWLIQQGAKLVTNVNDILDEIGVQPEQLGLNVDQQNEKSTANSLATEKLLASVDYDITAIDVIAQRNAISVSQAMALLLEYELRGLVAAVPGGYVKLRGK